MTRVLMLGWEFPPFITGGLGTACHGLTRAMSRRGTQVTFVLPKAIGQDDANAHVDLVAPGHGPDHCEHRVVATPAGPSGGGTQATPDVPPGPGGITFIDVPAPFSSPYALTGGITATVTHPGAPGCPGSRVGPDTTVSADEPDPGLKDDYDGDLLGGVHRYASFCLAAARRTQFDVVHAHDWMTYPAGMWISRATGRPLVVHIHSTEFDRSGEHVHQQVYDIERAGLHAASRVITVSELTKNVVVRRYGVPSDRVEVVYNGVDLDPRRFGVRGIKSRDKVVLYFGRITYQKGPEFFVRAAQQVLDVMPDVTFVVAGNGDQAARMIQLAADLGIGNKILFTGFLRGDDIKRVFSIADLYVMPSISEPFGIAPLEAMGHDVPAIISKTSGVSEVLTHALKVDFWDTKQMADQIVAVLRFPSLSETLRSHGAMEVRSLTWDGAARRCQSIYDDVIAESRRHAG